MHTQHKVLQKIQNLRNTRSRFIIAIDGRGGSGKTTLAQMIVREIPSLLHIEYDWFHLRPPYPASGERYDRERLTQEVLFPFLSDSPKLRFSKRLWVESDTEMSDPLDTTIAAPASCGLLVEGCETLDRALADYYQLRIWLESDPDEACERGIQRDLQQYDAPPDKVKTLWQDWKSWERKRLELDDRRMRADLTLAQSFLRLFSE